MSERCPYTCRLRTDSGYCAVTACVNPLHNGSGTYVLRKNGPEKYFLDKKKKNFKAVEYAKDCISQNEVSRH